jgi:hypothetical protein
MKCQWDNEKPCKTSSFGGLQVTEVKSERDLLRVTSQDKPDIHTQDYVLQLQYHINGTRGHFLLVNSHGQVMTNGQSKDPRSECYRFMLEKAFFFIFFFGVGCVCVIYLWFMLLLTFFKTQFSYQYDAQLHFCYILGIAVLTIITSIYSWADNHGLATMKPK